MKATLLVGALLVAFFSAACGKAREGPPPRPTATPTVAAIGAAGSRTVTDMLGRQLLVPETIDKVVAISPAAVSFATTLGLTLIGRPSDVPAPAGSQAVTVGSTLSPDFNAISNLAPDLVIGDAAFDGSRLRDFERFPYPVFVIKAGIYDEIIAALTALGDATGHEEQATAAATSIQERAGALISKAQANATHPTVLILTGAGRELYGGSDATYAGSLVTLLAATNVLGVLPAGAPIPGFGTVDLGQLASKNPDVVLTIPTGGAAVGGSTLAADLRASPAWAGSNAVKNNRVYEIDPNLYLRNPGPNVADAMEHLYSLLYP